MAILSLEQAVTDRECVLEALIDLNSHDVSAVVVSQASYELQTVDGHRTQVRFPWIDELGLYAPDRPTEIGGTGFLPDMPPHIDPHPDTSLKVQVTTKNGALARFVANVPTVVLDETNELPDSGYAVLSALGIISDEVVLREGDAVCFLGSVTLHEFKSIGLRESYINSYRPSF